MTDPIDPTDLTPPSGIDPVEARVRAALAARAQAVAPGQPDPTALAAAISGDELARRRRLRIAIGAAAAAVLAVAAITAGALVGDDTGRVTTANEPGTTSAPPPTDPPQTTTIDDPTTTAPATTTTGATTTTVAPTTTTAPPTTTTIAALPGATLDPKQGPRQGNDVALLSKLRVSCNEGSDRIVFEFLDGIIPEWQVEYHDDPITTDGSGEVVPVAGDANLSIRFDGAWGHDFEQEDFPPTYTGPARVASGCPSALEVVNTGEFEAIYAWVVGVPSARGFTVTTLQGPARVVIDLAHG